MSNLCGINLILYLVGHCYKCKKKNHLDMIRYTSVENNLRSIVKCRRSRIAGNWYVSLVESFAIPFLDLTNRGLTSKFSRLAPRGQTLV